MGFLVGAIHGKQSYSLQIMCKHFVFEVDKPGYKIPRCVSETVYAICKDCSLRHPKLKDLNYVSVKNFPKKTLSQEKIRSILESKVGKKRLKVGKHKSDWLEEALKRL